LNSEEFSQIVERLRRDTEHFSNIEVIEHEKRDDGHFGDDVIFDMKYVSLDELGEIKKRLKIHRFPEKFPDDSRVFTFGGKVIISELKKCPTCGHEEWKNVTREVGAKLLGGSVSGW